MKNWRTESELKHPVWYIGEFEKKLKDEWFSSIENSTLPPHEMFRLMQERSNSMVYISHDKLNEMFWDYTHQLLKKHSLMYRLKMFLVK